MAYTLKKLNVVKVVESALHRDGLLAKGFELVELEEKKSSAKKGKPNEQTSGDT